MILLFPVLEFDFYSGKIFTVDKPKQLDITFRKINLILKNNPSITNQINEIKLVDPYNLNLTDKDLKKIVTDIEVESIVDEKIKEFIKDATVYSNEDKILKDLGSRLSGQKIFFSGDYLIHSIAKIILEFNPKEIIGIIDVDLKSHNIEKPKLYLEIFKTLSGIYGEYLYLTLKHIPKNFSKENIKDLIPGYALDYLSYEIFYLEDYLNRKNKKVIQAHIISPEYRNGKLITMDRPDDFFHPGTSSYGLPNMVDNPDDFSESSESNLKIFGFNVNEYLTQDRNSNLAIISNEEYLPDKIAMAMARRFGLFHITDCSIDTNTNTRYTNIYIKNVHSIDQNKLVIILKKVLRLDYRIIIASKTEIILPQDIAEKFVVIKFNPLGYYSKRISEIFVNILKEKYHLNLTKTSISLVRQNQFSELLKYFQSIDSIIKCLPIWNKELYLDQVEFWYKFALSSIKVIEADAQKVNISFKHIGDKWNIEGIDSVKEVNYHNNKGMKYLAIILKHFQFSANPITALDVRSIEIYSSQTEMKAPVDTRKLNIIKKNLDKKGSTTTCRNAISRINNSYLKNFYTELFDRGDFAFKLKDPSKFTFEVFDENLPDELFV